MKKWWTMTTLTSALLWTSAAPALAEAASASRVLKCAVSIPSFDDGGKPTELTFDIFKDQDAYYADTTTAANGRAGSRRDAVTYSEHPVQAGLTADTDAGGTGHNQAERLIVHAMVLAREPAMGGKFTAGLDLAKVRSARVYQVGAATSMGSASIVVASDSTGAVMGAFLGGFLVAPCK